MRTACWKSALIERKKCVVDPEEWAVKRLEWIADRVTSMATEHEVTHVFVEGYAYGSANAREVLAELGGVVKHDLFCHLSLLVRPVVASSARKSLLGRVPSRKTSGVDVKDYVNEKLARMGAKFGSMDEGDAFIVANHGRMLLGLPYVGVGP